MGRFGGRVGWGIVLGFFFVLFGGGGEFNSSTFLYFRVKYMVRLSTVLSSWHEYS